jgi:hypothetical protein
MGYPPYADQTFLTSFSQAFLNFISKHDPTSEIIQKSHLSSWPVYSVSGKEMVFNKTENDATHIYDTVTDGALLERCRSIQSASA